MNTTKINATGVNGQQVTKELPAEGEIVVITTGNPRVGIRHTVAKVTGFVTRSISGTEYGYYATTAVTATGEELTDTRVRPATAEEIAQYEADTTPAEVPFEIVSDEAAALDAHSAACLKCSMTAETGRSCPEGQKLWEAAHRARNDFNRAPIITVNRFGNRKCFWSATSALSEIGINGGEIVKAPAGMIEAGHAENARQMEAARQRAAARRASGQRIRPPRR